MTMTVKQFRERAAGRSFASFCRYQIEVVGGLANHALLLLTMGDVDGASAALTAAVLIADVQWALPEDALP